MPWRGPFLWRQKLGLDGLQLQLRGPIEPAIAHALTFWAAGGQQQAFWDLAAAAHLAAADQHGERCLRCSASTAELGKPISLCVFIETPRTLT